VDFPKSVPSIGLVAGKFVDENPLMGTPGSLVPSQWGNAVTDEILSVILAAGLTPDEVNNTQLVAAIRMIQKQPVLIADTGAANAYTAANAPALPALPASGYIQRLVIANANTGASTYSPDGLAAKPIYGLALQPLQGGELPAGIAVLMYLVQAGVNGGNGAWIIIESLGGTSQVAPATKSQHAMQLGQALGRLIGIQVFSTPGTFTYTQTPGTNKVIAEVQAAGGAGGGAPATGAGVSSLGAPGGAGSYAKSLLTSGFSGVTITVGAGGIGVIGSAGNNGGPSSFGALISCPGGRGGLTAGPSSVLYDTSSLNSSAPSGGNIVSSVGSSGANIISISPTNIVGGNPGASLFGAGSKIVLGTAGAASVSPGAGGGGTSNTPSLPAFPGGAGAPGVVIIWEYA
jgi:hypothetical protein